MTQVWPSPPSGPCRPRPGRVSPGTDTSPPSSRRPDTAGVLTTSAWPLPPRARPRGRPRPVPPDEARRLQPSSVPPGARAVSTGSVPPWPTGSQFPGCDIRQFPRAIRVSSPRAHGPSVPRPRRPSVPPAPSESVPRAHGPSVPPRPMAGNPSREPSSRFRERPSRPTGPSAGRIERNPTRCEFGPAAEPFRARPAADQPLPGPPDVQAAASCRLARGGPGRAGLDRLAPASAGSHARPHLQGRPALSDPDPSPCPPPLGAAMHWPTSRARGGGTRFGNQKDLLLSDRLLPPGRDPGALAARLPGPAAWPSALGHYGSESRPPVAPRIATVGEFGEMPSEGRVAAVTANAVIAAFEPPEGSLVPAGHGGHGRSRPVTAGHGRSRRSRPARPVTACTAVVAVAPLARRTGYARARCACGWTAMVSER